MAGKTPISAKRTLPVRWNGWCYLNPAQVPSLSAPTGLTATPTGPNVAVVFTDNTGGSASHEVWRSPDDTNWTLITTLAPATVSFNNTGLTDGTYYYRARAVAGNLQSAYSASDSAVVSSGATGQRTITGTGFGGAPTVSLFHRMDGTDGQDINLTGDIGAFAAVNGAHPKYITHAGRTWMAHRNIAQLASSAANLTSVIYRHGSVYTKLYREFRWVVPTGRCLPGCATPNDKTVTDTSSRLKLLWGWIGDYGDFGQAGSVDCCYGTFIGSGVEFHGNHVYPARWNGSSYSAVYFSYSALSAVNENVWGTYVSGRESSPGAHDGTLHIYQHNGTSSTLNKYTGVMDFWRGANDAALPGYGEDTFVCPGWQGSIDSANTLLGLADFYEAVGDNCDSRIYCHNSPSFHNSTQKHIVPPDEDEFGNILWSDTEIKFTPNTREALPYVTVFIGDTMLENVSYT